MIQGAATLLASGTGFAPEVTIERIIGILLLAIGAAMLWGAMKIIGGSGGTNPRKSMNFTTSVLIALIPVAIFAVGVLAFAGQLGTFVGVG